MGETRWQPFRPGRHAGEKVIYRIRSNGFSAEQIGVAVWELEPPGHEGEGDCWIDEDAVFIEFDDFIPYPKEPANG